MDEQLEELKGYLTYTTLKDDKISHWSVGLQIEHILLTDEGILEHLLLNYKSNPEPGTATNLFGYFMLWTGYIPRGKGKSPEHVVPQGLSVNQLQDLHQKVCHLYKEIHQKKTALDQSLFAFPHPYFGMLSVKQWLRFLEVHTHHHLKIIRELLRAAPQNS